MRIIFELYRKTTIKERFKVNLRFTHTQEPYKNDIFKIKRTRGVRSKFHHAPISIYNLVIANVFISHDNRKVVGFFVGSSSVRYAECKACPTGSHV